MKTILIAAILCIPLSAFGDTVTKSTAESEFTPGTLNQGWYSSVMANFLTNDNYFTGIIQSRNLEIRSYFTFNLSGVVGTVIGATLQVQLGTYSLGVEQTATAGFFDVSTDAVALSQKGQPNSTIFTDLGTGNLYGTFTLNVSDHLPSNTIMNVALDGTAISDINSHLGQFFSIGAAITTTPPPEQDVGIFGITQGFETHLVLTVPEPSTLALLTLGGVIAFAANRR